jgi:hypothetical protein
LQPAAGEDGFFEQRLGGAGRFHEAKTDGEKWTAEKKRNQKQALSGGCKSFGGFFTSGVLPFARRVEVRVLA